jgi:hypothetical protein
LSACSIWKWYETKTLIRSAQVRQIDLFPDA